MEHQPTPTIKRAASVSSWVTPGRRRSLRPGSAGSKRRHGPSGRDAPPFQPYEMAADGGGHLASRFCHANWSCLDQPVADQCSTQSIDARGSCDPAKESSLLHEADESRSCEFSPTDPAKSQAWKHACRSGRPSPSHQLAWKTCLEPRQSGKQVAPAAQLKLVAQRGMWKSQLGGIGPSSLPSSHCGRDRATPQERLVVICRLPSDNGR